MVNIAIIVNTLQSGGAEKQSIFLYNAIQKRYKTHLVVLHRVKVEDKLVSLIQGNNPCITFIEGNIFLKIIRLLIFYKINNITHIFTLLTKPNVLGSITGKIFGVKSIYSSIRNSKLPTWKSVLERFITNHLSTETIFNNYSGEQYFRDKGILNTKVIPNCFVNISAPSIKDHSEVVRIITVGRFVEQKDYFTAIKAIKELSSYSSNFKFIIVGYGKLEKIIREEIRIQNITNCTEIYINPDNISELLIQAHIYLSTSLFEGTSNSIMEAMNASLPIVATSVGDNNKLVQHNKNGFLHDIGDYKGIANSLFKLLNNYELRVKFGVYSNKLLRLNYSFEKFQKSYIKLIESQ